MQCCSVGKLYATNPQQIEVIETRDAIIFYVYSKDDKSQLNLPHGTNN